MPARETYMLHVYRSRAASGWQWAARLERLPGGEHLRFHDPEALLAHLRAVLGADDPSGTATRGPPTENVPGTALEEERPSKRWSPGRALPPDDGGLKGKP